MDTLKTLTADDRLRCQRIMTSDDPAYIAREIDVYYRDLDRAERTPRSVMYLHMGLLSGWLYRILDERKESADDNQ